MSEEAKDMTPDRLADLCIEMEAGENILCTEEEEKELRLRGYIRKVKPTDKVDSDIDYTISKKGQLYARYALMQREKPEALHE